MIAALRIGNQYPLRRPPILANFFSMSAPAKRPASDAEIPAAKKAKSSESSGPAPDTPAAARTVLHWFRTDLRIADNTALWAASRAAQALPDANVAALFVVSPDEWKRHDVAPIRIDLWMRQIASLKKELMDKTGIPLVVARAPKRDDVPTVVARAAKELNAVEVTMNIEYEVNEAARDETVKKLLEGANVKVTMCHDQCVVAPGICRTKVLSPNK